MGSFFSLFVRTESKDHFSYDKLNLVFELNNHRRYTSEEVEAIKSIIDEINQSINIWSEQNEIEPTHFYKMQQLYLEWKVLHRIVRSNIGLEKSLLHYLCKLSYLFNIQDNISIVMLMKNVYRAYGEFYIFTNGDVLSNNDWTVLFGSDNWLLTDNSWPNPIQYFLHHANKTRTFFNGCRIVDYFVINEETFDNYLKIIDMKSELLLLFFRHGAIQYPFDIYIDNLVKLFNTSVSLLWNRVAKFADNAKIMLTEEDYQLIEKIKILLRIIPQINTNDPAGLPPDVGEQGSRNIVEKYILDLSRRGVMNISNYLNPSRLIHLCRCTIRCQLLETWNLPNGIRTLKISSYLQDYIDILED